MRVGALAPFPQRWTRGGPVNYTVSYSDANFQSSTLSASDITLNKTGTANGTVNVSGSGATRTVAITGITGDGNLGISLAAGTASDRVGNAAPAAGPSRTFSVGNTPPTVTISPPSANGNTVTYTVSYDGANGTTITLRTNDITLSKTGTANGTVSVSGNGNTRTITLSNLTGDGTLSFSMAAGTAADLAGNRAAAAGPSEAITVDNTPPTITISAPSNTFIRNGPVTYTVTYADANFLASTLSASDVALESSGTADGMISVSGSGAAWKVTISEITGFGTLGISIASGTGIDQAGNMAAAAGPSASFTVDNTAPSVTISAPSTTITRGGPVTYTVSYNDANFQASTLTATQVTLNKSGTANGTVNVSGTGETRTVTISGITGDGSLGISIADGTANDRVGNLAGAAGPSGMFMVDNTAPTVTISAPSTTITASSSVSYTVSYADANFQSSTLGTSSVTLNRTGTANGTVSVSGSGATRTVTITGITGDGTLGISISAGTASDRASNLAPAAGPSRTFAVGNTPPAVTISPPSTSGNTVIYTVSYDGTSGTTVTLSTNDITLNKTGSANGTVSVSGSGNTRTITLSNLSGDGTLSFSIAAGTATDLAGNRAAATGPSETFTVDTTPPTITIGSPSRNFSSGESVSYTVSYGDANLLAITLSSTDVALNTSGTATAIISVSGSGNTRTVTISRITGDGILGISVPMATAIDQAGNLAPAAGPSETFAVRNIPLVIGGTITAQPVNAKLPFSPFLGVTISDGGASTGPLSVTITVDPANKGTFSEASLLTSGFTQSGAGVYTFSGTSSLAAAAIRRLSFVPAIDSAWAISAPANAIIATNMIGFEIRLSDGIAPHVTDTNTLVVATFANRPPVVGPPVTIQRIFTQDVKVPVANLLADASDPDDDPVSIGSVSPRSQAGASVESYAGWIIYTPPAGFTGDDAFTYLVSDGFGGTATGTIKVIAGPNERPSKNLVGIQTIGGGTFRVTFNGIPGRTYRIQYSIDLTNPNWITLGAATVNSQGVLTFDDSSAAPARFYRTVYP